MQWPRLFNASGLFFLHYISPLFGKGNTDTDSSEAEGLNNATVGLRNLERYAHITRMVLTSPGTQDTEAITLDSGPIELTVFVKTMRVAPA
ncbi:hypothetical protein F5051DRAFT_423502 [Lentinula edodes]|nr:hypothetical protein F5051DRAFT_423502 [Lentinula edodes]